MGPSVRHERRRVRQRLGAADELTLLGADIACYRFGNRFNHEPKSQRKLLVHAKEVLDLKMKTEAKGLTLVPLKMFLKNGRIKVDLGVCRGKQLHDKRDALKKKAIRRDLERGLRKMSVAFELHGEIVPLRGVT